MKVDTSSFVFKIASSMVRAANIKIESARHLLNDPIVGNVLLVRVEEDAYMVTPAEYNKIQKIVNYLKLEVAEG